ncbi:unnamed protein product [Lactuca virosa]|uniref:Uncharacterized protein n=1 Tax=Lactuca virosa TaxID=75947 RepID=A0AAU9NC23_9ASTR|nr:unnamed protein product [Lactuca virosa]
MFLQVGFLRVSKHKVQFHPPQSSTPRKDTCKDWFIEALQLIQLEGEKIGVLPSASQDTLFLGNLNKGSRYCFH